VSSESTDDEFLTMMEEAGFTVTDSGTVEDITIEYTGVTVTYYTEQGYPVSLRIEFPVGQAMDAARAAVLSGTAANVNNLLAGAVLMGDASVFGYLEANGIDPATFSEDVFRDAPTEAPPLSDADEFFTL
jgi:hypothetical protein